MPVCTQKSRLSTSPGSSFPKTVSITGLNHGSYSPSYISETTSLPASSEPPNSAFLSINKGTIAISTTITSKLITSFLFFDII